MLPIKLTDILRPQRKECHREALRPTGMISGRRTIAANEQLSDSAGVADQGLSVVHTQELEAATLAFEIEILR